MQQQKLTVQEIKNGKGLQKSFYIYTLSLASLAAGATNSDLVNIENDSQFVWIKTSIFADIAGAVQTDESRVLPLINVQLTDTGSARQFFDEPQPVGNFAGSGQLPQILPAPFIFSNNANINASFTNFSNATTYANIKLSLIGFRVYQFGNTFQG